MNKMKSVLKIYDEEIDKLKEKFFQDIETLKQEMILLMEAKE